MIPNIPDKKKEETAEAVSSFQLIEKVYGFFDSLRRGEVTPPYGEMDRHT